ncbi:MAG: PilT/PilU family type 4a pilus ATPase [Myxococcales bacterium]|nr:PilT/PilU family type 4a pilus ATPase [Myxococcales bacterium]
MALPFFTSEKNKLLDRIKRRDWKSTDDMRELFIKLADQPLKIEDLLWMLSEPDRAIRSFATDIILKQKFEGVAGALLQELKEATGSARTYIMSLIPRIEDTGVFDRLEKMLTGKDQKERDLAIDVILSFPIERIGKFMSMLLEHENRDYRYRAFQRLLSDRVEGQPFRPEVIGWVRKLVLDKDERIRIRCIQVLAEKPDAESVTLFLERLSHEEYNVRTAIIKALDDATHVPGLDITDKLLSMLSQDDDQVRTVGLKLLVKSGNAKDTIRRILLMSGELMGWMRERLVSTIREFGDELLQPLVELLDHNDPEVRKKALIFANDFDSPTLVEPVAHLLDRSDSDWWTRVIALDVLGRLKDERAVDALIKCLESDETRWSAVEALGRIGSKKALAPIAKLLGDRAAEVRTQVIAALELYNDPRALPLLQKSMEKDPEVDVRERALQAFKHISEKHKQAVDEKTLRQQFGYTKGEKALDKLLVETRRIGASDLHVAPTSPPTIRIFGALKKMSAPEFTADQTEKMVLEILDEKQRERFQKESQVDLCYNIAGVGRYRTNIMRNRLGISGVFRVIPNELPTFLDTGLPSHLTDIVNYHQGLMIISGPAGSGKSTTLAALINLLNEKKRDHVLTLEDPIEFVHPFKGSLVNQREIGKHSKTFASALRAALREDPDCIIVGELRDAETMVLAMTAAETGHLVIGTMNTTSAVKTVDRLVGAFPPKEQQSVRMSLSEALKIVTSQTLLPRADGKGRIACHEVLMIAGPVRNLIRDDKTGHIPSAMTVGKSIGMQTVDMALMDLLERKLVTPEVAYRRSEKKDLFEAMVSKEFLEGIQG